ncbi:MAG: hypothetical protein V1858_00710 [Candidatus Gottesmanbacteria bacterium]
MSQSIQAVLKTLVYADIFDYPLNFEELHRFLISDKPLSFFEFKKMLMQISTDLEQINTGREFYFLSGRDKLVDLRKKREKWGKEKFKIAQKVGEWFKIIPWIKMVGITGALAINNSDKNDDIDILIVCSKNRLWLTRLLVTILTEILGIRRRPEKNKDKSRYSFFLTSIHPRCELGNLEVRNKICLNMFLDEDHLLVPIKERDLYTAHEVCQLKLLWDRGECYQKFLNSNQWIKKYLPNAFHITYNTQHTTLKIKKSKILYVPCYLLHILEILAKSFQLLYMRKRRTTEVISEGIIRFHPHDARPWILGEYNLLVKKLL